ncbi:MAG TPA: Fis family transcriptional regulator [Anaeromyxobacter sp.]|nr:Fis family transcriptional regulator [Anaeromyxobacter sp.]
MAELDPEILERVLRWCGEAGRQVRPEEARAALAPLGWDELLKVRALLADPPPSRPLGPLALVDLARGAPADVAAEREREGRYLPEPADPTPPPAPARAVPRSRGAGAVPSAPVVHRRRDRAPPPGPRPAALLPALEELFAPAGRALLERLIRAHGARRSFLVRELSAWRGPEGPPAERDLDALLDHHGLAHAFAHRERDELLHALRAARGSRAAAATRVGLTPEGFGEALARLGAMEAAERIREERRAELRRRGTLAGRCRLLLEEGALVEDLGLAAELLADLRLRLPEHLRALRAGPGGSTAAALARSLALPEAGIAELAARAGLRLDGERSRPAPAPSRRRPRPPGPPRPRTAPRGRGAGPRQPRPARTPKRR